MRFKELCFVAAAASLAVSPCAQAQEADAVFKPSGGWTADFGDDYCRLIRTFSDGTNQMSLAIERTQPGVFAKLIFVGTELKAYRGADQIGFQFLPAGASGKSRFVASTTADGKPYYSSDLLTLATLPPFAPPADGAPPVPPPYDRAGDVAAARGITGLALTEGLVTHVRLETGSLGDPIAVMQSCTDDLLKVWGLDPEKHKTMTAVAIANPKPGGVLPMGTIPFTEFGKFGGGANQVRLIVGADGKPKSCTVFQPSLDKELNERICSMIMAQATFQPAKDAAGQPMASYWMGPPLAFGPPPPPGFGR